MDYEGLKRPFGKDLGKGKKKKEKEEEEEERDPNKPKNELEDEFKPGTWVEIFGLDSEGGKKLNGQQGTIVKYVYEKIRFEVQLTEKVVSVRPVNLRKGEKPDRKWGYGDTCRLVGLREHEDEKLRDKSGSLAILQFKGKDNHWKVDAQGEIHQVLPQNLRVCFDDDERGLWSPDFRGQYFIGAATVVSVFLGLGSLLVLIDLNSHPDAPRAFPFELNLEPELPETAPGYHVAGLTLVIAIWAFFWLWGSLWGCYRLHSSLIDPQSCLPRIPELGVGRTSAGHLFRLGFGTWAGLFLATVFLHHNLVVPRLPWVGEESNGADDALFWGAGAAGAVGVYGLCLRRVRPSWPGLAQKVASFLILWAFYRHLNIQSYLYFPSAQRSWARTIAMYIPGLEDAVEDVVETDYIKEAREKSVESVYLKHPVVNFTILVRHLWLTRMPWGTLMIPILKPIYERGPENSKVAPSTLGQSMLAWVEWFLVLNFALIHISYAPELMVASILPMPGKDPEESYN
jgi:hypothetical protein